MGERGVRGHRGEQIARVKGGRKGGLVRVDEGGLMFILASGKWIICVDGAWISVDKQ